MAELEDGTSQATVERSVDSSGTTVIHIGGEIDMSNVRAVEADLEGAMSDRPDHVVFDVSALGFIDSSGIAVLLRAAEKTARLELRNPSATVRRILQATGLSDVLHIEP
jgi:stage II sporulation protein AA (anti-sigma F factor antagonist)